MCICEKTKAEFKPLNNTASYSGLELSLCKNMLRTRYFNNEGYMISQDIVIIRCCPLCGQLL